MINQSFINKRKVVSSFAFLHSEFLGLKTIGLKINLTSKNVGSGDSLPCDVCHGLGWRFNWKNKDEGKDTNFPEQRLSRCQRCRFTNGA